MSSIKITIDEKKLFKDKLANNVAESIKEVKTAIEDLRSIEKRLIKLGFPEFDWMYQDVTYTWECKTSPIGYCVYDSIDDPAYDECLFCHKPEERK